MKRGIFLGLILLLLIPPTTTASATEYIRLTGAIKSNLAAPQATTTIQIRLKGQFGDQILDTAMVYRDGGTYSMVVPKNTPVEIMVSSSERSSYSHWRMSTAFKQDSTLNINVPQAMIKISGRMVDAQSKPLTNAFVQISESPMDDFQISSDGTFWNGIGQSQSTQVDAYGNFALYSYPTQQFKYKRTLTLQEGYQGFKWISTNFIVDGPIQFVVCIPTNFGASLSLPPYCTQDQIAKAAAEGTSAATEANRKEQTISASPLITGSLPITTTGVSIQVKSTSNLPVFAYNSTDNVCVLENGMIKTKTSGRCVIALSQEGNSEFKPASNLILDFNIAGTTKKTTITCVKGKLTKKVTGTKPKCPSGYKVKK